MNKNILFVYEASEKQMEYVIENISKVTASNFIKFKATKNNIVLNFSTEVSFPELKEYIESVMTKISKSYFLIEYNENVSVNFPENQSEQFLNLEELSDELENLESLIMDEMELNGDDSMDNFIFSVEEELEDDEDMYLTKPVKVVYRLDDILDKINDCGIDSLTEEEKKYLNSYKK